jgi:putative Holliday junction resolvase
MSERPRNPDGAPPSRVLGVDFGDKRIGLAVSDPSRTIAFPHDVIEHAGNMPEAARLVFEAANSVQAAHVVVGLPFNMDGTRGKQADRVSTFVGLLRKLLGPAVRVEEWDERLSSVQAGRLLQDAGVRSRLQVGKVDQVAAALVLQAFLDSRPRCGRAGCERPAGEEGPC